MFSSQVLETGIGLVFMIFVLAIAASGVLELGNRLLNVRAKDLEVALQSLLSGSKPGAGERFRGAVSRLGGAVGAPKLADDAQQAWNAFTATSVYQGLLATRNQIRPAYLSAQAFAEAVDEMLQTPGAVAPLAGQPVARRQAALALDDVRSGSQEFRAGLERWYDEAMTGLSARYRKKSSMWLLFIGPVLAGALNASVPHVAEELWRDSATRAVVVAAAEAAPAPTGNASTTPAQTVEQVAATAEQLTALGLPIGWSGEPTPFDPRWWGVHLLGWLLTGALCSMGGPFWFDVLGRLTAIRSPRPPTAVDDDTSATHAVVRKAEAPVGPAAVVAEAVPSPPVEPDVLIRGFRSLIPRRSKKG